MGGRWRRRLTLLAMGACARRVAGTRATVVLPASTTPEGSRRVRPMQGFLGRPAVVR